MTEKKISLESKIEGFIFDNFEVIFAMILVIFGFLTVAITFLSIIIEARAIQ